MLLKQKAIAMLAVIGMASSCVNDEMISSLDLKNIDATIEVGEDPESRVSVDPDSKDGTLVWYWNPTDEIGVFTSRTENNLKYVNTNQSENVTSVTFMPDAGVTIKGTPRYAYYPYSSSNGSKSYSSLPGTLPQNQVINENMDNIPGCYRYGSYTSTSSSGSKFSFKNIFATIRIKLDATDTELEGENLKDLDIAVTRKGNEVIVCGDFTFNARYGTYTTGSNVSNKMNIKFAGEPVLDGRVIFLTSVFPKIIKSDVMTFTVRTTNYTATFDVIPTSSYSKNYTYTYTVNLKNAVNLVITKNEVVDDNEGEGEPEGGEQGGTEGGEQGGTEGGEQGGTEGGEQGGTEGDGNEGGNNEGTQTPVAPTVITGQFTCATYNVDGLPKKISLVTINGDGPGADGTNNISAKIAQQNWDFVGFSEDFEYHSNLISSLSAFQWGTHRGSVSSSALYKTLDTDGLEFAARRATCSWSEENITAFTSSSGGLTSGANTCIKKGFRHYPVTVAEGVVVDVIITHMNTYSSSGSSHINAQHAQLKQIAQYINNLVATNNRPVILMGDTNCRYTRHDFKTYFLDVLNSNLTYADPWVEYQWNGVYPTYPSKSLMVSDATGTDSSTDIICENTQKGEVVDKIIYINNPNAPVQIKALNYLRDYDNFNGLADHMPIVSTFKYEKTVENSSNTPAAANYNSVVMNGGNAFGW